MTNEERIAALAQEIYLNRHNQTNNATGTQLTAFLNQTITWVNQFIPELEKKADWNFMRTQNDIIGTVSDADTISYELPSTVRKLVVSPYRDLTIQQDSTTVAHFKVVSPNQSYDPSDTDFQYPRVTQIKHQIIFSRPLTTAEVDGTIVADTIGKIPKLSLTDVSLLDILDDENYEDIRLLFIMGVVKNQILPDIVQGGLTPTYAQKFDRYLADCVRENNESAEADNQDHESFGWVSGVGF